VEKNVVVKDELNEQLGEGLHEGLHEILIEVSDHCTNDGSGTNPALWS
jgi:hypothetical protein